MALRGLSLMWGRSKLSSLEKEVLAAVSSGLSSVGKEVFNTQIDAVNLVQRHANGKEVNLYVMRRGKPVYEERHLFPLRQEMQLANVTLAGGRAEVWLVEGWVFSILFDKPPKRIFEHGMKIERVEILCDPMIAESVETAPESKRQEKIAAIRAKVPDEYLRLLDECKGTSVNDWVVFKAQNIRKIVLRDSSYYLLAEKEGMGAVGIKEDESSGQIYYLDYGDNRGERINVGLRKFFEEFDGGRVAG